MRKPGVGQYFFLRPLVVGGFLIAQAVLAGNFYAGLSPATVPWTNGIVPYEFTNALTATMKQTYLDGLREWELAANVKFVPHTNQTRWVLFTYNTNGFNNVSASFNPQVVSVASLSRAQVGHEMGHSFGFDHENIRPDQTNYLTILSNNVTPGNLVWFQMNPASVTNGSYDYESVMHLGRDFASTQPGVLATQQPKPPYFARYQFRLGNDALSPGDRAALKFLYGPPTVPTTNIVTTTADVGAGSLRAAMYYAIDHPGAIVRFNLPTNDPGYSNGIFNLHLTGHLPTLATDGIVIDGATQPGFTNQPLIVVDASQIIPETFTADTLLVYSANNQIKNISLQGFNWNGVTLLYADATNNTIAGCWIGVDATGSNAAPNAKQGVLIDAGASRNIVGGTNALARNVLSGNREYGLWIAGSNTAGNLILGNYIGTDPTGSFAISNWLGGVILVGGTHHNVIGGTTAPARNVLSGNTDFGLWLGDPGTANNTVGGNFFGLNASGTAALPNTFIGMYVLNGAQSNLVLNNVFSGHPSEGLRLTDPGTAFNLIQGNYFGTDASGSNAIPNAFAGVTIFGGATSNLIGGTTTAARNLLSGNYYGAVIGDSGTAGNLVQGNLIGVSINGQTALANSFAGLALWNGASGNFIGGTNAGAGNLIAFDGGPGLVLFDSGTTNNAIRGNSIFSNGGLGVDLNNDGVTANDTGDADTGPNNLQNFPVITNAFGFAASTIVKGELNSATNRSYSIDFYRNLATDLTGHGEGQFYVGSVSVTTDGSGKATFALTNTSGNYTGQYLAATATSTTGDTSEFSAAVIATNVPAAAAQFATPFVWRTNGFIFNLTLTTNFGYRIQATTNLAGSPVPWIDLTNFIALNISLTFTDRTAPSFRTRFYRVVSP